MTIDVTHGLPFPDCSVDCIFSEHFIEHITREDSIQFLTECYRILQPGGVCRIATPDLAGIVGSYTSDSWRQAEWVERFGYDWIPNRCVMLNMSLREWSHLHVFDYDDLKMVASVAGFLIARRCELGESQHEALAGLEHRKDSFVIELTKDNNELRDELPLVSILIPAYNPSFLSDALQSALGQTYPNTEILVVDDHPGSGIDHIVGECCGDRDVRFIQNEKNRGAIATYSRCLELARGKYVKFLNDDDLLAPDCVRRMVCCFEAYGERVTLVTSKRRRIDETGMALPDEVSTSCLFRQDSYVYGIDLGNCLLRTLTNVVGEPSTTMFRRQDSSVLLSLNGRHYNMNVDMVLWLNLLRHGDAIYLVDELSSFRQHVAQEQRNPLNYFLLVAAWDSIVQDAKAIGFLQGDAIYREASLRLLKLLESSITSSAFDHREREHLSRRQGALAEELTRGCSGGRDLGVERSQLLRIKDLIDAVQRSEGWIPPVRHRFLRPALEPSKRGKVLRGIRNLLGQ